MKLFQIEYMLEACKHGSISKAAENLNVSRPAISRVLRDLEDEFGLELFERTTGGVSLTETGCTFYQRCKSIMSMVTELKDEMSYIRQEKRSEQQNIIRLGLSPLACSDFFPDFYKEFAEEYPDIIFETHETLGTQNAVMLSENTIDAGIAIRIRDRYDEFMEKPGVLDIINYEVFFLCGSDHPLASRDAVAVADIKNETYIQLDKTLIAHDLFSRKFPVWFEPNIKFRTTQVSMISAMVRTGQVCSLQFRKDIKARTEEDGVVYIPFKQPVYLPLRILWNDGIPHVPAFRKFIDYLKNNSNN